MKLIIDIPEEKYERIIKDAQARMYHTNDLFELITILKNGTPLDDVKEQMKKTRCFHVGTFEDDNPIDYGIVEGFDKAIAILDNIGKTESEDT